MMTEEMVTPSEALQLLSSMYLCRPTAAAIENWRMALSEHASVPLSELKHAVIAIDTSSRDELEALLWEYTRLFIGPYRLPCPPWESVYTSPKRLMMQDAADEMLRLYREADLMLDTPDIMPDHIGAELNFLAFLLRKSREDINVSGQSLRVMDDLLNGHILKWIPDFTHDMENAAETRFYKTLARVTENLLKAIGS